MITTQQAFVMIRKLMTFPYPEICRHHVALEMLSLLEENGVVDGQDPEWANLCREVCKCNDPEALIILEKFRVNNQLEKSA